ncbi:hypothetical protein ABZ770_31670 [Streptomyces sp. NPDC006654]|uniref:hypothetical protein n=1 Tax=Streptomyces sp. NPDC006654 TaxID=3156897 RepID=UPI0033C19359
MVVAIASSAVRRGSKAVASSHSVGSAVGIPYVTGSVGGADPALFEPGEVVHADRGEPDDLGATQV